MGQKHSTDGVGADVTSQVPITHVNFNPEVEVLQKTYDPHYGEIKLVRDVKTAEKFVLKEITVNSKTAFETEQYFYTNRVALKHPNVVNIIGYNSQDKHNFCSTYYKLSLYIENLEQNLKTDYDTRKEAGNPYTDSELLFIADDLIAGLSYFQNQGVSHGDIRPLNIFVKEGCYKLSDPSLNAQKGSNALTHAIVQGTKTLLSPHLIAHVPQNKFDLAGDQYKNDVFSLGATLLSLATLTDSEDLYDYQEGKLNEALLSERLETLRRSRNSLINELIVNMLTVDEAGRPDFVSLSSRILPHREQIRAGTFGNTIDYLYGKISGEQVKRSAPPPSGGSDFATDDLEAKIRAALERSEATFRAVQAGSTTTTATYSYTGAGAPTYTSDLKKSGNVEALKRSGNVEALKKSSAGAGTSSYAYGTSTYTPSTYTPSTYAYTAGATDAGAGVGTAGTYGGTYTSTTTYTPATTYTTTPATDVNAGTAGGYSSTYTPTTTSYTPATTYTTTPATDVNAGTAGGYSSTYTPGTYTSGTYGGYTSGGYSSYVPASTYTTYNYTADAGTTNAPQGATFSESVNQYKEGTV